MGKCRTGLPSLPWNHYLTVECFCDQWPLQTVWDVPRLKQRGEFYPAIPACPSRSKTCAPSMFLAEPTAWGMPPSGCPRFPCGTWHSLRTLVVPLCFALPHFHAVSTVLYVFTQPVLHSAMHSFGHFLMLTEVSLYVAAHARAHTHTRTFRSLGHRAAPLQSHTRFLC